MPDGSPAYSGSEQISTLAACGLGVDVIDTFDAFCALKTEWQALEAADPARSVFLSWVWLSRVFRDNPGVWCVLSVRDAEADDALVCLFPLHVRQRHDGAIAIAAAGDLVLSPYGGWLCHPDYDPDAVHITGMTLRAVGWDSFDLTGEMTGRRAEAFAHAIGSDPASAETGEINAEAHIAPLPETFACFLKHCATKTTAKKLSRMARRRIDKGLWRVSLATSATPRTAHNDIELLLQLWQAQSFASGTGPDAETLARAVRNHRALLVNALAADALVLSVLWAADRPIAALAHILDHDMDHMHTALSGSEPGASEAPVELFLHGEAIRWAIEHGFSQYQMAPSATLRPQALGAAAVPVGRVQLKRIGALAV